MGFEAFRTVSLFLALGFLLLGCTEGVGAPGLDRPPSGDPGRSGAQASVPVAGVGPVAGVDPAEGLVSVPGASPVAVAASPGSAGSGAGPDPERAVRGPAGGDSAGFLTSGDAFSHSAPRIEGIFAGPGSGEVAVLFDQVVHMRGEVWLLTSGGSSANAPGGGSRVLTFGAGDLSGVVQIEGVGLGLGAALRSIDGKDAALGL